MAKQDTFKDTVYQLVDALGGKENIESAHHCATRFRVILKDDNKVNKEKLENIDKSKGWSKEGQQWQIIFGAGIVNKVFDKYQTIYDNNLAKSSENKINKEKINWNHNYSISTNLFLFLRNGIRSFADIFIPLIPIFIAGGLSLALNSFISVKGIGKDDTGQWLNNFAKISSFVFETIGGGILGSLPVFVGFSAAKKWGANPWLGGAMGLILIAPLLINSYSLGGKGGVEWYSFFTESPGNKKDVSYIPVLWKDSPRIFDIKYPIFGIPLMGYQAQIVPTLLVILVMKYIEKGMQKISHESIAIISVPLVTVVATTLLAFVIIGPIGYVISLALAEALKSIFIYTNFPGFGLGGAILGAIYAPIVVTGLHQGFLPIESQLLASYGESWITPIACVSNVSQAFACLGAFIYLKNKQKRAVAASGALSANLGITEPALFGININMRHFFLAGIIGSAVGGYWLGMTQTTANSLGSASWIGLIQFDITTKAENLVKWYQSVSNATPWGKYMNGFGIPPIANAAIAMTLSSLVSFIVANILSWTKQGRNTIQQANGDNGMPKLLNWIDKKRTKISKNKIKETFVYAPISGQLLLPIDINDSVFKQEMMGKTFAIRPNNDLIYSLSSPIKGQITNIFETGHAITINNKENSVLVHIGLETAQINKNAPNLKQLKCFKYKKLILSKTRPFIKENNLLNKIKNKINKPIVDVESSNLLKNGATSNDIFVVLLNETIKDNQKVELIAQDKNVEKGQPIFKILTEIR